LAVFKFSPIGTMLWLYQWLQLAQNTGSSIDYKSFIK